MKDEPETGAVTIIWRGWNQPPQEEWRATRAGIPHVQGNGRDEKSALKALLRAERKQPR